jgi:hypothetical protein
MGVWNLNGPFLLKAPTTVFSENFETFSGWTTLTSGTVTQSSAQAYEGSFSGLRSTAGDPSGAYKLLTSTVNRLYIVDAWFYSVEPRAGAAADSIAIVNSSGNGYGFQINATSIVIERRDAYVRTTLSSLSATRTGNVWYRATFQALSDNTFSLVIRDASGAQLASLVSTADFTHSGPFDRVAILGGFNYHVDNLVIKKFSA